MKYLLIASALLSSQVFAKELKLNCVATYNSDKVLDTQVVLASGQSNLVIGGAEEFDFILSSKANDVVELQAFNSGEPSRTYATATIKAANSIVELSIWKRDLLMEVRCTSL